MKLMKSKQKKTLAERPTRPRREKLIWTAKRLGVVLLIIILIGVFYHVHSRQVTKQRFTDTNSRASIATATVQKDYQAQAIALGIIYSPNDIAKTCYMDQPIGGGPGGGGPELWCGVSVTKTISVPPSTEAIDAMLDKVNAIAKSEGLIVGSTLNDIPSGYARTPNYNSDQFIEYSAGNGNAYDPGGYGCSVYAKSNYLPYNSQGDYLLEFPGQASQNYAPGTKQASLYYELKCDGASTYVPTGYIYLK